MSKQKKESDDEFDDDFIDKDDQPTFNGMHQPYANGLNSSDFAPDFSAGMGMDGMGGFGGGLGGGLGRGFGGGLGGDLGGGFGGGFGRMGGMGLGGMGVLGGHMHGMNPHGHPDGPIPDLNGNSSEGDENVFNYGKGSNKKEQEKLKAQEQERKRKEHEEKEEQRLKKLTKKLDIPQEQQITLVDWAIRGQLQVVRLVLEYILVPYKQKKYIFLTKQKWQKEDLPKMIEKYPAVELPYLQDGEKIVWGIEAMIVHIAHKYNRPELIGRTPEDKIRLATGRTIYWQAVQDYLQLCYGQYEQDVSWQRAREKYVNQRFRVHLNKFVSFMRSKTGEKELMWIDFGAAQLVSLLNTMDFRFKDHNINIQNYASRVYILPQYNVYRKSNRFHQRPYNGMGAIYK